MINLPQNDYLNVEKNGITYSCCTLRQKVRHTIGLDYATRRTLYKRNGKMHFKPTRNSSMAKMRNLKSLLMQVTWKAEDVE